jgi:hypothetical protein
LLPQGALLLLKYLCKGTVRKDDIFGDFTSHLRLHAGKI